MKTLLAVFLTALFISCGGEKEAVRYIRFRIYDPAYIALELGLFEKHGVNLEIIDLIAGGPTALQAISGGSAEIGVSSYMAIINASAQGLPVIAISDIQSSIGTQPLEEFFVRSDSGIETITDLTGKNVAINLVKSSFHYTWLMALEAASMAETDVEFVILPFEQQELALLNNRVDAIGVLQPFTLRARENPEIRTLFTALDVFGERQFTTHVMNSTWAEENPGLAEGFVGAIAEAVAWIEANQSEAREIISRHTGIPAGDIENYYFQEHAAVVMADAQFWLDYMRSTGEVTAAHLTVNDFATNRFNPFVEE